MSEIKIYNAFMEKKPVVIAKYYDLLLWLLQHVEVTLPLPSAILLIEASWGGGGGTAAPKTAAPNSTATLVLIFYESLNYQLSAAGQNESDNRQTSIN